MPDDSNNDFIHQIWAQTDQGFACKCTKTWKCDELTDGQKDVSEDECIPIPLTTSLGDKMGSVIKNLKNDKKSQFCDCVT